MELINVKLIATDHSDTENLTSFPHGRMFVMSYIVFDISMRLNFRSIYNIP